MAPSAIETITERTPVVKGLIQRAKNEDGSPLYPDYMPFYDPLEKVEDLGYFDHFDPGHRADPTFPNLLANATKVVNLSPHVGSEIEGVQLSKLSSEGLDELALLAAQRGCLVFRNQDFCDIGFEAQKKIVRHFGPLHIHGWAPHPAAGSEEHMIIYDHKEVRKSWKGRSPVQWHTDQSPEPQPPGTTFICMLESPAAAGGDTLVSSSVQAYKSLSPRFRKRLEGLTAIHTNNDGVTQEMKNGQNAVMRRKELVQEHPVVIVHPVTKEKALYVNPVYTKKIVGFDDEESEYLLKFLFDHIAKRQDFQCRVRYEAGTCLVWDQRVTNHSQTLDYPAGDRRHAFRLTPLANKPIPAKIEEDDGECEKDINRVQLGLC
ncbi:putative alpha-ketoglutarate-dependent taurine dioxygenase protein [Phaeoacremonium minimum UCRPA7]|uniref:Putative alpha-ketoglutarate-dependent taurine dioxygenase protein n=1 Tax=Phaeoacremonium minimum (strain UCR-PA7) TaxID=1286976 RepID=R8BE68_PHAM7|nr:putative alpha-ketoglutarate-dependent taurine dioxygenase protein [Phaeoacremonium minimum UCRPA7]EON97604.1 putative alpha-ketoglutarate-dependent taurine dioxygenase protein [Phaeoacremonium minimum UCRPA7]